MTKVKIVFVIILTILLLPTLAYADDRVIYEDFEDNDFSDTFCATDSTYWDHETIITNNPHEGTHSLRGNACTNGCTDSITGLGGSNRTNLNIGDCGTSPALGTSFDLAGNHTDEIFVRFWLYYDDNFHSGDSGEYCWTNKVWWTQFESDTNTYYVQFRCGDSISYYDEANECSDGYGETYTSTTVTYGSWHKWEIYLKYNTFTDGSPNSDGILKIWVDDVLVRNATDVMPLCTEGGKVDRLVLGYFHSGCVDDATYNCGWQLDQVEVYTDKAGGSVTGTMEDGTITIDDGAVNSKHYYSGQANFR